MEPRPAESIVGQKLGSYRIEAVLGEGGMGTVYRALHEVLGRPVAVKTLKPTAAADPVLLERFFAEARAANVIRHENIVECTDLVHDAGGLSYIVMELLDGRTLGQAIRSAGRLPVRRATAIAAQIADALAATHAAQVVHRDLKPENIFLIRRAGTDDYVKVLDFGIARLRPDLGATTATQSGALIGTPAYMSPEQVRGEKAGPAADIYALGTVLYHMLSGRLPFSAASGPLIMAAHANDPAPRLDPGLAPRHVVDLVARMLAKVPAERPASMDEVRRVLLSSGPDADVTLPSASVTPQSAIALEPTRASGAAASSVSAAVGESAPVPRRGVSSWIVAAGIAGALGLGVAAIWLASRRAAAPDPPAPRELATAAPAPAGPPDAPAPPDGIDEEETAIAEEEDALERGRDEVEGSNMAAREGNTAAREKDLAAREKAVAQREHDLAEREAALARRERESGGSGGTVIVQQVAPQGSKYSKKDVELLLSKARQAMAKRGILQDDLPATAQDLEHQATEAMQEGDYAKAYFAASQLRATVDSLKIDRSFVSAKVARLSAAARGKTLDDATKQLFEEATSAFADGNYALANSKLNKIYATLR